MKTKIEFSEKTKKGQIVNQININIHAPGSRPCTLYPAGITVTPLKIVYQTNQKIALSDEWITILDRRKLGERKESYRRFLNDISISVKTTETYFPNGIFANCITNNNPSSVIKEMKKSILNYVHSKYSWMLTDEFQDKINSLHINNLRP